MSKNIAIVIGVSYLVILGIYASFSGPKDSNKTPAATAQAEEAKASAIETTANETKEKVANIIADVKETVEHEITEIEKKNDEPPKTSAHEESVLDYAIIDSQRKALADNTKGKGFGPQSPRDIDSLTGNNTRIFEPAPASAAMNLCNIHIHKNAEHKGGEFTTYAGNGDGHGYHSGYRYNGTLSETELAPYAGAVGSEKHGKLVSGDTIEVHYVYSTAGVVPGPGLISCLSEAIINPQVRVETQVYVLVNDSSALDFAELAAHDKINGYYQALNIPTNTGAPVQYIGSTTGPSYNEKGSPLQVTWSVRPKVAKVNIATLGKWFESNIFNEDHAHGVRNLVINLDLLSDI